MTWQIEDFSWWLKTKCLWHWTPKPFHPSLSTIFIKIYKPWLIKEYFYTVVFTCVTCLNWVQYIKTTVNKTFSPWSRFSCALKSHLRRTAHMLPLVSNSKTFCFRTSISLPENIPRCSWAFTETVMECTVMVFSLDGAAACITRHNRGVPFSLMKISCLENKAKWSWILQ